MTSGNLPLQLTTFIGRQREIAQILDLVTGGARLVTLTGTGGIGKTRLALQVAQAVSATPASLFPDSAWFVPLAALAPSAPVAPAFMTALDLREIPGQPLTDALIHSLRSKKLLLLADNCEHLLETCAPLFETLLQSCPGIRILAASRAALNLPGETLYPVPPLETADPREDLPLAALAQCEAVRLFGERATGVHPDFAVTEQNARAVMQICRLLEGIPLAIELAAIRVRMLTLQQIAARLGEMSEFLRRTGPTVPPRHQSLRTAFEWSHALLTEPEQVLFRRLAVFAGGWTLEAADQVAADTDLPRREIVGLHERLLDQSLIGRADDGQREQARYRMLVPVQQYALEKLAGSGETARMRDRHLACFTALAERAWHGILSAEYSAWMERIDADIDNLRAALSWSMEEGDIQHGLRMAVALFHYWLDAAFTQEGIQIFQHLLNSPKAAAAHLAGGRARALAFLSLSWLRVGDHLQAAEAARMALTLEAQAGNAETRAYALAGLGHAHGLQGRYEQAFACLKESLDLFRTLDHNPGQGWALSRLGTVALHAGEYEAAEAWLSDMADLMRASGNWSYLTYAVRYQSYAMLQQGNVEAALEKLRELLQMYRRTEDVAAGSYVAAAAIAVQTGQLKRAARIIGFAAARLESFHYTLLPYDQELFDQTDRVLRAGLGERAFHAGREHGKGLTDDLAFREAQAVCDPGGLPPESPASDRAGLTEREVEVLALVERGLSNQAIADTLVISRRTVHAHLRSIYDKLHVTARAAAAHEARRLNLL